MSETPQDNTPNEEPKPDEVITPEVVPSVPNGTAPFAAQDEADGEDTAEKRSRPSTLDRLPEDAKQVLDGLIAQGKGSKEIRQTMRVQFKGRNADMDEILDSNEATYRRYGDRHADRIKTIAAQEKALSVDLNASLVDMKDATDALLNPVSPLENKKQALMAMYDRMETRLKLLEARNSNHWIDPQYELLIRSYIKDQQSLVESLVKLQEELKKDGVDEFYKEFKSYTYMLLVQFNQVYKQLWGEDKFLDFHQELEKRFHTALDQWLADRNVKLD